MTKGKLCFMALCFVAVCCNAQDVPQKNVEIDIDEDLKSYLLMKYDDIKISEIHSKNNEKKNYVKKSLGSSLLTEAYDIKGRDIYFKDLSAQYETHFGVVYFYYATPAKAKSAIATIEKKGIFANTKILTKYIAVNAGAVNVVFFTESSANKIALDYLDSIANKVAVSADKK